MASQADSILLTEFDQRRLHGLLKVMRKRAPSSDRALDHLERGLARAKVVRREQLPPTVVTMNSQVCLRDPDSGERVAISLVFPEAPNPEGDNVPVLSPMGLALLGCREGDLVEWQTPRGPCRARVDGVLYQPEAAGHFAL